MVSYRPFPPQSFPPPPLPNQNPLPPQHHYDQNYNQMNLKSNYHYPPSRPPLQQQPPPPQQQYSYPLPPPPPPDSSYPPPPPPPLPTMPQNIFNSLPPMYYPPSQYPSQYGNQAMQPPPPSSPGSLIPPPPPPSSPPPPPPPKESVGDKGLSERSKGGNRDFSGSGRREHGRSNHVVGSREHKPMMPPIKKPNGAAGRVETEEERRLRKKMEFEKQRQEEKHRQQMKESQNAQMMSSGKGHGSMIGSRMGDGRATPFLSGERFENRLKKPTTFLCKLK